MTSLVAAAPANPLLQTDVLIGSGLLALTLIVGAAAIMYAERWKKRAIHSVDVQSADDLAEFRELFEKGEITEEEYDKIRQRTAQRMKHDLGLAPASPPASSRRAEPPPSLN